MRVRAGVIGAGLLLAQPGMAAERALEVLVAGSTRTISLADLQRQLQPARLTVYNPAYQRSMTYDGFWLDQVLKILNIKLGGQELVFECKDGYGTSFFADEVGLRKWLMAYNELGGWTPLPHHAPPMSPGPWYVVGSDPNSFKKSPWPYQVTGIKVRGDW
jgi:hypothetical protein